MLAFSHRSRSFKLLVRWMPRVAVWASHWLARHLHRRRERNGDAAQLLANFARAFPQHDAVALSELHRQHLTAKFHAGVLATRLQGQDQKGLLTHVRQQVRYRDPAALQALADHPGPIVLLTPHYGAYLSTSLKLIDDLGPDKRLNIFFDDPAANPHNAIYEPIYRRMGGNWGVLYNNRRSLVAALKSLRDGQVLTMMPDVHDVAGGHVLVPFFGGLAHAMTGTAFFAHKADALLVPLYSYPVGDLEIEIDIQPAIPLSQAPDFEQAVYETTASIMRNIETQLRRMPQHWIYWQALHRRFPCAVAVPDGTMETQWKAGFSSLLAELNARAPVLAPMLQDLERRIAAAD